MGIGLILYLYLPLQLAHAAIAPAPSDPVPRQEEQQEETGPQLAQRLSTIHSRVVDLQAGLLEGLKNQKQIKANVRKIQRLMALQKTERELGRRRLADLAKTVESLEARRGLLNEKISDQKKAVRQCLIAIEKSNRSQPSENSLHLPETERLEAPRRKVLANLVDRGLKEIETLRADLDDADKIEFRIQEEKQQLAYLFQDLKEEEGVLELNRQLQVDLLRKKTRERLTQLENYRKLKFAESQVEHLIRDFNARIELERATEVEREASRAMARGAFAHLKGMLPLPVESGKVISAFGRAYDPRSKLYVFKKGIDIASGQKMPVRAVSAGKIAFAGELPDYGRVTIIDHGDHFYSLCAHLGDLKHKAGEMVAAGDAIGLTDQSGTPVYFEIRSRNVAVNPLQWLAN